MKTVFILFSILLSFASCNTESREEENQPLKIYTLTAANGNPLPFKSIYTDSAGYDTVWTAIGSSGMLTLSSLTHEYEIKFNKSTGFVTGAIKSSTDQIFSDQGSFTQNEDTIKLKDKETGNFKPHFLILKNNRMFLYANIQFGEKKNLNRDFILEFR